MKNLSEILDLIENFPEEEEIRRIYGYLFCRFLDGEKAGEIIERTYKKVLAFSADKQAKIELFPSIAGEGVVEGNSLVLVLAAMPQYDVHGNLADKEKERKRVRILVALKNQLEPIFSKILDMPVRILIKES